MNKELNPELIAAKEKAQAIIESCVTCDHFSSVVPYIELFHKQFNDENSYNDLLNLYQERLNQQCR